MKNFSNSLINVKFSCSVKLFKPTLKLVFTAKGETAFTLTPKADNSRALFSIKEKSIAFVNEFKKVLFCGNFPKIFAIKTTLPFVSFRKGDARLKKCRKDLKFTFKALSNNKIDVSLILPEKNLP